MPDEIKYTALFRSLTADQKRELAERLGSSVMALSHYAAQRYRFSAERAIEVTDALQAMGFKKVRRSWCRPDLWP